MTIEEKRKRAEELGIPMPVSQLTEGSVIVTAQNQDKYSRLQALKSGAKRADMANLVKAKSAQQSFEGIPEVKQNNQRQNPNQPSNRVSPGKSVAIKGFEAPKSNEFSAMENMFGGGNSSPSYNPNPTAHHDTQLSIDNAHGPSYNPNSILAEKRAKARENMAQNSEYMQYALGADAEQTEMTHQGGQQSFDLNNIRKMMESIARETISSVLDSYTEKNKSRLTFEHTKLKTEDGFKVIKTGEGKYYKIIPVTVKKS